jgi:CAAD domains of cyanobacterial aminoacyl-tRNA synthetase
MESKIPPSGANKPESELPKVEVKVEVQPPEAKTNFETTPNPEWKSVVDRVMNFIDTPPSYISNFFELYKRPLIVLGLILGAFVTLKVLFGLIDAVNDIPLIAPTLELIGVAYTLWFVYRYLLGADSRRELVEEIQTIKEYVLGKVDSSK